MGPAVREEGWREEMEEPAAREQGWREEMEELNQHLGHLEAGLGGHEEQEEKSVEELLKEFEEMGISVNQSQPVAQEAEEEAQEVEFEEFEEVAGMVRVVRSGEAAAAETLSEAARRPLEQEEWEVGELLREVQEKQRQERLGATMDGVEAREVMVRLAWDKEVELRPSAREEWEGPELVQEGGEAWVVRSDEALTEVEEKVRMMFQCTKSYNQIHLRLRDGQGRDREFIGELSLAEVQCGGREVTMVCGAQHNLHQVWCCYRPDGALLQAAVEDRVAVAVSWYTGDFSREPPTRPWRTVWSRDAPLHALEAFLRTQLVLKNPEETLLMLIKEGDECRGYFYSCLTPRELRLTTDSSIYCVGLSSGGTFDAELKLSWAGWDLEARARFGGEAAERLRRGTRRGEVEVRVAWATLVASRLTGYQQGTVLLTCSPTEPLLQLEAFLRSQLWPVQPRHRLHLTVTTSSSTSTDFYGLQTVEELCTRALLVQVEAVPAASGEWAAYRAAALLRLGPARGASYWKRAVLGLPHKVLGKAERVGEESTVQLVIISLDSSIESINGGRDPRDFLWRVVASPSWHTVR